MHRLGVRFPQSALDFGDPPPMASKIKMVRQTESGCIGCSLWLRSWSFLMKVPYKGVGRSVKESLLAGVDRIGNRWNDRSQEVASRRLGSSHNRAEYFLMEGWIRRGGARCGPWLLLCFKVHVWKDCGGSTPLVPTKLTVINNLSTVSTVSVYKSLQKKLKKFEKIGWRIGN